MSYHFDIPSLALRADVSESIVQAMLNSLPVQREDAQKILTCLSARYHKDFRLETVYVVFHNPVDNKSEVARIMQKIDTEYESALQGMRGLSSGTAQHTFITKRMEIMARQFAELRQTVGEDEAMQAILAWQDQEAGHRTQPDAP
jgi:hypothetical protein